VSIATSSPTSALWAIREAISTGGEEHLGRLTFKSAHAWCGQRAQDGLVHEVVPKCELRAARHQDVRPLQLGHKPMGLGRGPPQHRCQITKPKATAEHGGDPGGMARQGGQAGQSALYRPLHALGQDGLAQPRASCDDLDCPLLCETVKELPQEKRIAAGRLSGT
jgi:hypothetical protein